MIAATIAYLISQSHSDWLSGESVEVIAVFAVYYPWFIYLVCIHSMPSVRYVIHYTLQVSKTINTKQQNMPHSGVYTKMWKRRRCVYTTIWMHVYMDRLMMRCWSCFAFFLSVSRKVYISFSFWPLSHLSHRITGIDDGIYCGGAEIPSLCACIHRHTYAYRRPPLTKLMNLMRSSCKHAYTLKSVKTTPSGIRAKRNTVVKIFTFPVFDKSLKRTVVKTQIVVIFKLFHIGNREKSSRLIKNFLHCLVCVLKTATGGRKT